MTEACPEPVCWRAACAEPVWWRTPCAEPGWWRTACAELAVRDPRLAPLIAQYPPLQLGARGNAFQTLARSIVGQQISVRAAQSVWLRFAAFCGTVRPEIVLQAEPQALRGCGLSARKVEYLAALARHFIDRPGGVDGWATFDDAAIISELTAVRGIGVWTAQMFLIFHLARPDVLPLADLGLQRAIELHYRRMRSSGTQRADRLSARWQPWRTVATWYLWRSLEPLPVVH